MTLKFLPLVGNNTKCQILCSCGRSVKIVDRQGIWCYIKHKTPKKEWCKNGLRPVKIVDIKPDQVSKDESSHELTFR